jgi:poly-gamma-glutamate capsule biosynthesis protein CapA/YwtB (metallophosphatase superfamily)
MRVTFLGDLVFTRELGLDGITTLDGAIQAAGPTDIVVGNLETVLHDFEWPAAGEAGGAWLRCPPQIANELREVGLRLVARANNHAGDWGHGGLMSTGYYLARAGVSWAGVGGDEAEAFAPAFISVGSGRLALIAVTTTAPAGSVASRAVGATRARPGVAVVPLEQWFEVPHAHHDALRAVCAGFGVNEGERHVEVGDAVFVPGDEFRRRSRPERRRAQLLRTSVISSSQQADVVVVSIHSHERGAQLADPSEGLCKLADIACEAGADVVFSQGPHVLRGGREAPSGAIQLFGLGNAVFQPDTNERLPADKRDELGLSDAAGPHAAASCDVDWWSQEDFWRSVVVRCELDGSEVRSEVVPVELDPLGAMASRGLPQVSKPEVSRLTLSRLASLSRALGADEAWVARTFDDGSDTRASDAEMQ